MLVYRYHYKVHGRAVSGSVIAVDRSAARVLLSRAKISYVTLNVDAFATLDLFVRPNSLPWKALAKLYKAMARGQATGSLLALLDGLGEFVQDYKITNAAAHIRAGTIAGFSMSDSMAGSGLLYQHVEVVRASEKGAGQADALRSLLSDCERRSAVEGKLKKAIATPMFTVGFILLSIWSMSVFYLPKMAAPLQSQIAALAKVQRVHFSPFVLGCVELSAWLAKNQVLFTVLFFGITAAIFFVLTQSKLVQQQLLKYPLVRSIYEMTEMATIWPIYALLRQRLQPDEVAMLLSKTSTIPESAKWFRKMYNAFRSGASDSEAVLRAEFPVYVINAVTLGTKRGDLRGELVDSATEWVEQVQNAADTLGLQLQTATFIFGGGLVLMMAAVMVYPRFAIQMSAFV